MDILKSLKNIESDLMRLESQLQPTNTTLIHQAKAIKLLIDSEIQRKLLDGKNSITQIEEIHVTSDDTNTQSMKRLKYYKELLLQAMRKQGAADPILNEKLLELNDEEFIYEKELTDTDHKLKDLNKKLNDARKVAADIGKNSEKYLPQQLDNMLQNLDELSEKAASTKERFLGIDKTILQKIEDLQKLLENSNSKHELQSLVEETYGELKDDLVKLKEELDKLHPKVNNFLKTIKEINLDCQEGGDYFEIRELIEELLDEEEELEEDI